MDIPTRDTQPSVNNGQHSRGHFPGLGQHKSGKWFGLIILILISISTVSVLLIALVLRSANSNDFGYVNTKVFQAIDVSVGGSTSGDQIYFGNIKAINSHSIILANVFYIPASSTSSSVTLEPLVCQIDEPYNQMVINRSSVNWWENLQSGGKIAKAITSYQSSNKTPTCPQGSSTTG